MASSPQPPDLIEEPDNGLMFTILRRSSSTGSLQVPASSIGFDGFVATAVKSPSDPNSGQNPAVKGFIGLEPPKIDALVKSVPQVVNYKDAGGEAVSEVFTATAAHVDSITVQNLVTVEGSSTSETIQKTDVASSPSLGAWAKPLRIYPSSPSAVNVLHEAGSNLLQELSSPSHWPSLCWPTSPAKNHTRAPQLTNRVTDKALPRNSANSSTDQVGASLASASPSVSVPEVNPDDIVPASVTVARIDSATIPTISTPVAAVASVTGTPVVAVASVTEHVPASMAPSPTVNIGSVHVPPTSVSTTVIEAMEALPISSDATLKSTSVSDGLVLTSSPTSFVEILPTTTESEPSTPATIFKATATPSSKSALAENAPLNTDHETSLEDFPATGSVFLTPPPEASSDILPSTSGGLSFTPFTGDCTGYFNEYEMAQRSRHGRQLKPSQKVQDMQWHTVRGRKSRGCRGRGRHGDQN
ncbi:hypothetical protein Bca52824_002717 [Brassica carinata]|uniref:Uncharacterized protein n=1 Tax=Brassica carinata TaxID=52824 RepID=A0A8X8BE54_BRACI|nr:hypothetical protein Bca52824_002717 [Brassica carinata]